MQNFQVIEGRLSESYNHFSEFRFRNCMCTDTRLMGVLAMRIIWEDPSDSQHTYQLLLHLDYSEYGIDELQEFEISPDSPQSGVSAEDAEESWRHIYQDLGGKLVELEPDVFVHLIYDAIDVARKNIMTGFDEYADFRSGALSRIRLMRDALSDAGLMKEDCSTANAIKAVIPEVLEAYEVIHYFIMRLADRDFDAAAFLSTIDRSELERSPIASFGIQSLMKNSIGTPADAASESDRFALETITMSDFKYYFFTSVIELSGGRRSVNPKVTSLYTGFSKPLSQTETAYALSTPEYITVYDIPDQVLSDFEIREIDYFRNVSPRVIDNGWFLPVYNKDNYHLRLPIYRINGDLSATALVSIPGELVVMSSRLFDANSVETSIENSYYGDKLILKGRYQVNEPVFQTLCKTTGAMFEDMISMPDDE